MRPIGMRLTTPEEAVADGSLDYLKQPDELGIRSSAWPHRADVAARPVPLVAEEMGWGDAGLAIASVARAIPALAANLSGDPELIEAFGSRPGCWLATQPDRGSDVADLEGFVLDKGGRHSTGNLRARVTQDEVVLSGQSSAWVSCAPIADTALAYVAADYGDGFHRPDGTIEGVAVLVPLDLPGRWEDLSTSGQRPLPQASSSRTHPRDIVAGASSSIRISPDVCGDRDVRGLHGVARRLRARAAYTHERWWRTESSTNGPHRLFEPGRLSGGLWPGGLDLPQGRDALRQPP
jgi:hypothetical protein